MEEEEEEEEERKERKRTLRERAATVGDAFDGGRVGSDPTAASSRDFDFIFPPVPLSSLFFVSSLLSCHLPSLSLSLSLSLLFSFTSLLSPSKEASHSPVTRPGCGCRWGGGAYLFSSLFLVFFSESLKFPLPVDRNSASAFGLLGYALTIFFCLVTPVQRILGCTLRV